MTDQQPHTPTVDELRRMYALKVPYDQRDRRNAEFDRFLAAAEQRGAVKAWRNGYVHGVHDERLREQIGAAEEPNRANPHVTNNCADQETHND